jgi:quercetin dioxygenase-like cupin family protein
MPRGVILSDLSRPTEVRLDGHTLYWKRMVLGFHLEGNWECVEWARVKQGVYFPPHLHDRTEELYYLISGDGTFITDGVAEDAKEGDLVLTGLDQAHALQVAPGRDLDLLIVELIPKVRSKAKSPQHVYKFNAPTAAPDRTESGTIEISSLDAEPLLDGGWGKLERWVLAPGSATKRLTQSGAEVCFLGLKGAGELVLDDGENIPVAPGSVFVTPPDMGYRLKSGNDGLTVLSVEVKLAPAARQG